MPKAKKSLTPEVEVLQDSNPWLTAYRSISDYHLAENETTIRKFQRDCGIASYNGAKEVMNKLVESGKAVKVGMKMIKQDGLRQSMVNVYRLINPNPNIG